MSGKTEKKSGNFEMDYKWQPCGGVLIKFILLVSCIGIIKPLNQV